MLAPLWIQQLIKAFKYDMNTKEVLKLLDPKQTFKNLEKQNQEVLQNELLFHIRSNFQQGPEQTGFQKFAIGFILHVKTLAQKQANSLIQNQQFLGLANETYNHFYSSVSGLEEICEQPYTDGKWIGPVLDHICKLLIQYGIEADLEIASSKDLAKKYKSEQDFHSSHTKLENAYSALEKIFRKLNQTQNNPPDNRRYAYIIVAIRIIKIHFKLNNFKACETFFKSIDVLVNAGFFQLTDFPNKYRVMLAYYRGKFYLFRNYKFNCLDLRPVFIKNDLSSAREQLRIAFSMCHNDYMKNKKKILKYLIPVEMNLCKFPTKKLLQKYQLDEYIDLCEACQTGDLVKFETTIETYMDQYVQSGVFLSIEKLRHLTLRNQIKNVALSIQKQPTLQEGYAEQPHIIRLEILYNILNKWDPELDLDELECILANQIYLGYIKGYISHEKRLMVLAKQNPFPLKVE